MRTQQQSARTRRSRFNFSAKSMLTLIVILFSCSYTLMAQQKDGDESNSSSSTVNAVPGRANVNFSFNFANLTLQNGEFLEMFGANNSRGILRGHPTIPGAEFGTTTADPLIFSTNGVERMRIWPAGNITIGTTLNNQNAAFDFHTSSAATYVPTGTSPARLRLINTDATVNNVMEIDLGSGDTAGAVVTRAKLASIATNNTPGVTAGDFVIGLRNAGAMFEHTRFTSTGNVGIGTAAPTAKLHVQGSGRVTGNLVVDGNIAAKYQDVAEWVPAAEQLDAGTVVVLDANKSNQVISSSKSYDTRVAGVISAQPGITLGEKGDEKVLVATTGRVLVNVDATSGPIQIGDLLVTSDREGFAMKSAPVEIGGARIHRPGTLIGKALEPLAGGTGKILVLLSLQ